MNKSNRNGILSDYERFRKQTWENFESARTDKKIFLFGSGKGLEYFFQHYQYTLPVEGILDNDEAKQGGAVSSYVFEDTTKVCRYPDILSMEILNQYSDQETVFVITSFRYYMEIAAGLWKKGFHNLFSLYCMKENEESSRKTDESMAAFIEECSSQPIDPGKMVFYTMGGYSGHGKRIAELLLQRRHDLDIVWVTRRQELNVPEGIRIIRYDNRRKFIYEMETAGYWIFDDNIAEPLKKRNGQCYIQLKHWASVTLKTFGKDLGKFRQENCGDMEDVISFRNGKMIDYVLTGSKFDEETFRKAFVYEGKAVKVGSPRSDILFEGERYKKKVCNICQLDENVHLLLYAPTFRIQKTIDGFLQDFKDIELDMNRLHETLEKRFGGTWIIFLRLHPNVAFRSREIVMPPFVIDVSDYEDGEELVAASDAMITDYSSIMFESAFVRRPVFLFAPDRHEYIGQERELLIDYDTLPFDIVTTNEELSERILAFDQSDYEQRLDVFFQKYGVHEDGHAGERAVDFLMELLERNRQCNHSFP